VTEPDPRLNARLTATTLETYFAERIVVALHLSDEPVCTLRIDPPSEQLELWTPSRGPEPDLVELSRVKLTTEELNDEPWFVLTVDARGAHIEAYSVIAAVVDDLNTGRPFHVAVERSLSSYRELLSGRGRISDERVVGLLGELLVLEYLVTTHGEVPAVQAWLGPDAEEHDFVLPSFDAEVKTTLTERRNHVIGNETQLETSPDRPLWLISIQLTRAAAAPQGFGLPAVIERIRGTLSYAANAFDAHLRSVGWRAGDADLYKERYMWRSRPTAYLVDDTFPAITRRRLDKVVPQAELVGRVVYRVDVTGLEASTPPEPLVRFIEERA
jgi:Putative  PD-(D/E)XK family member, (DUF4420)